MAAFAKVLAEKWTALYVRLYLLIVLMYSCSRSSCVGPSRSKALASVSAVIATKSAHTSHALFVWHIPENILQNSVWLSLRKRTARAKLYHSPFWPLPGPLFVNPADAAHRGSCNLGLGRSHAQQVKHIVQID